MLNDKKPGTFSMRVQSVSVLRAEWGRLRLWNRRRHDHLDLAGFPEADLHHGTDRWMAS